MAIGRSLMSLKNFLQDRLLCSPRKRWRHESLADTTTAYMLPISENPIKIGSVNSVDGGSIAGVLKKKNVKKSIFLNF